MEYWLTVLFIVSFTAFDTMVGRVVKVTDGDTITILKDCNKQEKIRLLDVYLPERFIRLGKN